MPFMINSTQLRDKIFTRIIILQQMPFMINSIQLRDKIFIQDLLIKIYFYSNYSFSKIVRKASLK